MVSRAFGTIDKPGGNVTENQRAVVLVSLVRNYQIIAATQRIELKLSYVGDSGCVTEIETLNGNGIDGVNSTIAVRIRRG